MLHMTMRAFIQLYSNRKRKLCLYVIVFLLPGGGIVLGVHALTQLLRRPPTYKPAPYR